MGNPVTKVIRERDGLEVERLRAVSLAATRREWRHNGRNDVHRPEGRLIAVTVMPGEQRRHDAEHIATFDPPTVLALLDVAQAAETVGRFAPSNPAPDVTVDAMPMVDLLRALARLRTLVAARYGESAR